jgi:hypothetical protein
MSSSILLTVKMQLRMSLGSVEIDDYIQYILDFIGLLVFCSIPGQHARRNGVKKFVSGLDDQDIGLCSVLEVAVAFSIVNRCPMMR